MAVWERNGYEQGPESAGSAVLYFSSACDPVVMLGTILSQPRRADRPLGEASISSSGL